MDPIKIIQKYYRKDSKEYKIILEHSKLVAKKALEIAEKLEKKGIKLDKKFIKEAAMLHDIGCIKTNSKSVGRGKEHYVKHGILGGEILEKENLPKHALVAERHIGVGIKKEQTKKLGLPKRDMLPTTIEEEIVCYADLFYSKKDDKETTLEEIRKEVKTWSKNCLDRFENMVKKFE